MNDDYLINNAMNEIFVETNEYWLHLEMINELIRGNSNELIF